MESQNESFRPLAKTDIPFIDGESNVSQDENAIPPANTNTANKDIPELKPSGILSMTGRYSFPFLLTSSVIQLCIYLNKLYEDSSAVGKYYTDTDLNYCTVSASCLFLPAFIYIIFTVSAYLKDQEVADSKEVGTKMVHGLLLVPWQIKGRVEVLQFSAQRVCQRRTLTSDEVEEKSRLERQAAALEFFEEFYAGLIQILLQLYIILISLDEQSGYKALTGQIVASCLTLMSMMFAVRRRDDGILTGTLSVIGWMAIMISRSLSIAMATTVLHGWMILVCLLHGILISGWVTRIALQTHYKTESSTTGFSKKRKMALFWLIFSVFGLPSLIYWPIMFELKKHRRPFIFLLLLMLESCVFVALWIIKKKKNDYSFFLVSLTAAFFVLGALFILFYICCKPKYTDQVVYHDMKARNADSFGMYFEFCDVAFKLTRKEEVEAKLQAIRDHRITS